MLRAAILATLVFASPVLAEDLDNPREAEVRDAAMRARIIEERIAAEKAARDRAIAAERDAADKKLKAEEVAGGGPIEADPQLTLENLKKERDVYKKQLEGLEAAAEESRKRIAEQGDAARASKARLQALERHTKLTQERLTKVEASIAELEAGNGKGLEESNRMGGVVRLEGTRDHLKAKLAGLEKAVAETRKEMAGGNAPAAKARLDDLERKVAETTKELAALEADLAALRAAEGVARPLVSSTRPAPTTQTMGEADLEKALGGKEVVELVFRGPRNGAGSASANMGAEAKAGQLAVTAAGPGNNEVHIVVRVTPEMIKELKRMRVSLHADNFGLAKDDIITWSAPGDEKLRKEAEGFAAAAAKDFVAHVKTLGPEIVEDRKEPAKEPVVALARFKTAEGAEVMLRVTRITPEKGWLNVKNEKGEGQPAAWAHFRKLGLIAALHYKPSQADLNAISQAKSRGNPGFEPETLTLIKPAFEDALTPLLKRERETEIRSGSW